jgi:uncharacterized FAD-dependent dehydrogenase
MKEHRYRLHGLSMEPGDPRDPVVKALREWRIPADALVRAQILRESLDARRTNRPVRKLTLELVLKRPFHRRMLEPLPDPVPDDDDLLRATLALPDRIHVVGSGPCGIACAIGLAEKGYSVVLHERGADLASRSLQARRFLKGAALDRETNFLFGEGGAGTFTDGKLTTRTRNRLVQESLAMWVACGEDPSIQWRAKPHLGTDRMRVLVAALRERFREAGGEIRFLSRLDDVGIRDGRVVSAGFSGVTESVECLVLAIGHSARDTAAMLRDRGVPFQHKDFAVGVRIEHPQALIDRRQYGPRVDPKEIGAAEYSLACRTGGPGAHSFCMCPGGEVLPTTTEPDELATNGMSFRARGTRWANAGLVVPVRTEELDRWAAERGTAPDAWTGIGFQVAIEKAAFLAGGGEFRAPAQRARDFLVGRESPDLPETSYARGLASRDLSQVLPDFVVHELRLALEDFDRKIPGFVEEGLLIAPETRTSSPLRIPRDPATLEAEGIRGLHALGEGAGWAGGIVTSAADGLRLADRAKARRA